MSFMVKMTILDFGFDGKNYWSATREVEIHEGREGLRIRGERETYRFRKPQIEEPEPLREHYLDVLEGEGLTE